MEQIVFACFKLLSLLTTQYSLTPLIKTNNGSGVIGRMAKRMGTLIYPGYMQES